MSNEEYVGRNDFDLLPSHTEGDRQETNVSPDITGPSKRSSNWVINSSGGHVNTSAHLYDDNVYSALGSKRSRHQHFRALS